MEKYLIQFLIRMHQSILCVFSFQLSSQAWHCIANCVVAVSSTLNSCHVTYLQNINRIKQTNKQKPLMSAVAVPLHLIQCEHCAAADGTDRAVQCFCLWFSQQENIFPFKSTHCGDVSRSKCSSSLGNFRTNSATWK